MAKKPSLLTTSSGYNSAASINTNLQSLRNGFDNTLSRDGSAPNTMEADIDLNSNDLLNVGIVNAATVKINGVAIGVTESFTSDRTDIKYEFATVAQLLAFNDPGYFTVGDYVLAGGFMYKVVSSGEDVTTADGVKLNVIPTDMGYNLSAFGITGSGDETTQLQAAFDAVSNGKLYGVPGLTVNYSTLTIPAQGVEFFGNGMTFNRVANSATSGFQIMGDFIGYGLSFTAPGAGSNRNLWVRGSNVTIDGLTVSHTAESDETFASVAVTVSASPSATISNVTLKDVSVTNISQGVVATKVDDLIIDGYKHSKYRTSVYLIDCARARLRGGYTTGLGLAVNGIPGENSTLIEATTPDASTDIRITDWVCEDSGEHGHRLGGSQRISDVVYTRCKVVRPGSSIVGGNTSGGVWNGGCGFKALGGTTVGGTRHRTITYTDCSVYDIEQTFGTYPTGHGVNNFTPYFAIFCDDVTYNNCFVGAKDETYSCRNGLVTTACNGVYVNGCNFRSCEAAAIKLIQEATDGTYPGQDDPLIDFQVNGGTFEVSDTTPGNGVVIYYADATTGANSGFVLNGPTLIGGAKAVRFETPGGGGSFGRVNLKYYYHSSNTTGPDQDGGGMSVAVSDIVGPYYSGNIAADGSRFVDTVTGAVYDRIAGAWQQRLLCVQSGYTPTGTAITNLDSVTAGFAYYTRIGNVVHQFGTIILDPTASGAIVGEIDLPIASALTASREAGGTFVASDGTILGIIEAGTANDRLRFNGTSTVTSARTINYNATYVVI